VSHPDLDRPTRLLARTQLRLILFCLLAALAKGEPQNPSNPPPTGRAFDHLIKLSPMLSFSCGPPKVGSNQAVNLDVRIINRTSDAISIFGKLLWGYEAGLILHVADEHGIPVQAQHLDVDIVPPPTLADPTTYLVLSHGNFLGAERTDTPENLFNNQPGRYSLTVEYRSPVPRRYAKAANFWASENGVLRSNVCSIEYAP
jgi:hypothetical protein